MNTTPGYHPRVKCTWTEALVLYKKLAEEVNRDKQRAVLQKGSFVFAHHFKHLEIPSHRCRHIQRRSTQLSKVHLLQHWKSISKTKDLVLQAPMMELVTLAVLKISDYQNALRCSWVNANKIVDLQGTANHPNDPSKKVVISLRSYNPYGANQQEPKEFNT